MFLPESVHKRIPQLWILMGLLLFACGLYLGFEYKMLFVYLGMGAVSLLQGIWAYYARWQILKQRNSGGFEDLAESTAMSSEPAANDPVVVAKLATRTHK